MAIKLDEDERKNFTGSTTTPWLVVKKCDTTADARSVWVVNLLIVVVVAAADVVVAF